MKPILDACCGARMFYFDKEDKRIVFQDIRELSVSDIFSNRWELYQEPIDWDYIIKNKCLCWFWDDDESEKTVSILINAEKDEYTPFLLYDECYFEHCRPVRRDEVTFYEDRKDV